MRAHHERISFQLSICNVRYDELDVGATTRAILDAANARLRGWIGGWADPLEARALAITLIKRRSAAFHDIELTSPPTVPGRLLTYLLGLLFAADHDFLQTERKRHSLISLRGPSLHALSQLRALPIRHRGEPWLFEWQDELDERADADALAISRGPNDRLVAGQLDAATRRRLDAARATGCAEDPLSARVFHADQRAIVRGLDRGDAAALAEVGLLTMLEADTVRALLNSARFHGEERVSAIVEEMLTTPGLVEHLHVAWRFSMEGGRALARKAALRALGRYGRTVDGGMVKWSTDNVDHDLLGI